jgi:hypothetical protein
MIMAARRQIGRHGTTGSGTNRRPAATFPAYNAPKVFCIGLSKTATTSLDAALAVLGLRSIHWQNPYTES